MRWSGAVLEETFGETFEGAREDPGFFHAFGRAVVGLQAHIGELQGVGGIDVGVSELISTAIEAGLAENDVVGIDFVGGGDVFGRLKPDEIYDAGAIGEVGHNPLLTYAHDELFKAQDLPFYLDEGLRSLQIGDAVEATAIDIFVRIVFEEVAKGVDVELFAQYLFAVRSDTGKIGNVLIEHCFSERVDKRSTVLAHKWIG